jgi:hypothetical protein
MMREAYHTHYVTHWVDETQQLLETRWHPATERMGELDFRYEMEEWLRITQKLSITRIYDHCVQFLYPISIEEQTYMAQLLNPGWIAAGVKRYAHIMPQELVSNLSTDQMFQKFYDMNLPNQFVIRHFAEQEQEQAWKWLLG